MKKSLFTDCVRVGLQHLPNHPQFDCYKHFSFIIQRDTLIEWGTNRSAPPMIGYQSHQKFHSENQAYFRAKGLLRRNEPFETVNIRFNKSGKMLLSKPCKCCISFLKFLGCRAIWFSTDAGFARLQLKNS
jgi:hypothetical protein